MYISIRLKFERLGPVKYLGHLDMLRYFQKAVMRSRLPIRYSEGFNPHQIMSFAYPLGVSMETKGDYMDIDLVEDDSFCFHNEAEKIKYEENIVQAMNNVMHEGISICQASIVPDNELNAMASVYAADYDVFVMNTEELSDELLQKFMSQDSIIVKKEGKKGNIKEVDIKEGIMELRLNQDNSLFMKLRSGSDSNIKASTIIELLNDMCNMKMKLYMVRRLEIYRLTEKGIKPLGDFND